MKHRMLWQWTMAVAVVSAMSACSGLTKKEIGTVAGGAVGVAAGSAIGGGSGKTVAMILGGLAGAVIGRGIGGDLDESDKMRAVQALEGTPTGTSNTWTNPDTQSAFSVTPTRTFTADGGATCRDFTMAATVGGQPDQVAGTACRQADGSWRVIN